MVVTKKNTGIYCKHNIISAIRKLFTINNTSEIKSNGKIYPLCFYIMANAYVPIIG